MPFLWAEHDSIQPASWIFLTTPSPRHRMPWDVQSINQLIHKRRKLLKKRFQSHLFQRIVDPQKWAFSGLIHLAAWEETEWAFQQSLSFHRVKQDPQYLGWPPRHQTSSFSTPQRQQMDDCKNLHRLKYYEIIWNLPNCRSKLGESWMVKGNHLTKDKSHPSSYSL